VLEILKFSVALCPRCLAGCNGWLIRSSTQLSSSVQIPQSAELNSPLLSFTPIPVVVDINKSLYETTTVRLATTI